MSEESFSILQADGSKVPFDKATLTAELKDLSFGLNLEYLKIDEVVEKIFAGLYEGVKQGDYDNLIAETCAYMSGNHPDYSFLASRVAVKKLHKITSEKYLFS